MMLRRAIFRDESRLCLIACALLALTGCTQTEKPSPVVLRPSFERSEWKYQRAPGAVIQSEHYEIYTTVRDSDLQDTLPQVMESAFNYYREIVPTAKAPTERMKVYIFAKRSEFESFTRRMAGMRAEVLLKVRNGGYSEGGISVIEYVAHEVTYPIMLHEGFHQYLHHYIHPGIPAWLNEGLAVLCEGHRLGGSGVAGFAPDYNPTRRNALAEALIRDKELFPLEELLRINAGHVVGGSRRKIDAYYAQVWALMLFLMQGEDGRYVPAMRKLLDTLGREDVEPYATAAHAATPSEPYSFGKGLFQAFIATDIEAVDREYRRFMRQEILKEK